MLKLSMLNYQIVKLLKYSTDTVQGVLDKNATDENRYSDWRTTVKMFELVIMYTVTWGTTLLWCVFQQKVRDLDLTCWQEC